MQSAQEICVCESSPDGYQSQKQASFKRRVKCENSVSTKLHNLILPQTALLSSTKLLNTEPG